MISEYNERTARVLVSSFARMPADCLRAALNATEGIEVVAAAVGGEDTCRYASGHKPDVVLMMPPPSVQRLEEKVAMALDCLEEHSADSKLVVLTYGEDPEAARISLKSGARGFVMVSESLEVLGEALLAAAAGDIYVNPRLLTDIAMLGDGHADGLTDREREVVRLLALGYSNSEASEELFLSVRTIESYRASIYEKLGISRRRDVVRYAIEKQLVP